MAIVDTINSIKTHIEDAYGVAEEKGATLPTNRNLENLANTIENIPSGGGEVKSNDVNFYDYDGTILYSYTKEQFLNMYELPPIPDNNSNMTYEEWNYTLSEAKIALNNCGFVDVGVTCHTTDGKTKIYVDYDYDKQEDYAVCLFVNGSVTIHWGDGETSVLTGTSATGTPKVATHTYTNGFHNYTIEIECNTDTTTYGLNGGMYLLGLLTAPPSTSSYKSMMRFITKIELSEKVVHINRAVFSGSYFKTINIPKTTKNVGTNTFQNCSGLRHINLNDNSLTITGSYLFSSCSNLRNVSLHKPYSNTYGSYMFYGCPLLERLNIYKSTTMFGGNAITNCSTLKTLYIPETVTTMQNYAVYNCYSLKNVVFNAKITQIYTALFSASSLLYLKIPKTVKSIQGDITLEYAKCIDFREHTQVPTLSSSNWIQQWAPDGKIVVPDNLYDTWITSANWSNANQLNHIVKASEYEG